MTVSTVSAAVVTAHSGRAVLAFRELLSALKAAGLAVPRREHVPALGGVLVDVGEDLVTISSFDGDVGVTAQVPLAEGSVSEHGRMVVDHGRLLKSLTAATKGARKVTLDSSVVELRVDEGVPVLVAEGFTIPIPTPVPEDNHWGRETIPAPTHFADREALVTAAQRVNVAADRGDLLPVLTAFDLFLNADSVSMTATDRYRVAREYVDATGTAVCSVLVPAAAFTKLLAVLDGHALGLSVDEEQGANWLTATGESVSARFRLMEGSYPQVQSIIDAPRGPRATLDKAQLLEAATRAAAITTAGGSKNVPVQIVLTGQGISIAPGGDGDLKATAPVLEAQVEGLEQEREVIALNPSFLVEGLKAVPAEQVQFCFGSRTGKPVQIHEAGPEDPEVFRYLLMPVRHAG